MERNRRFIRGLGVVLLALFVALGGTATSHAAAPAPTPKPKPGATIPTVQLPSPGATSAPATGARAASKPAPRTTLSFSVASPEASTNFSADHVAAGVLTSSGHPDLAVISSSDSSCNFNNSSYPCLEVLLGNGDGTFQAPVLYPIGPLQSNLEPEAVAIGDVNGDGHADIVVASYNGSRGTCASYGCVSVLLGNGDGTFQGPIVYDAGGEPAALALGHLGTSGKLDIAVANTNSYYSNLQTNPCGTASILGCVSVLLNNGFGGFSNPINTNLGNVPSSIALADFNGDGKTDIAVVNRDTTDETVSIAVGNGNGTFQTAHTYQPSPNKIASRLYDVVAADFNGDGHPDIAVTDTGTCSNTLGHGCVWVMLGTGTGTMNTPAVAYAAGPVSGALALGDFNNDHTFDLAALNTSANSVSVILGNGNGSFQAPQQFLTSLPSPGGDPQDVSAWDVNQDGRTDLIFPQDGYRIVSVLLNTTAVPLPCSSVSLVANPSGSAPIGTTVQLSALAQTCTSPLYEFWALLPGGSWVTIGPYSSSNALNVTTSGGTPGNYQFAVWAKDASSSQPYDTYNIIPYTLTGGGCTGATLTPIPASPQAPPANITFYAAASGTNCQYEFWGLPYGGSWVTAQAYSAASTWSWNVGAGTLQGFYQIAVWAKAASSTQAYDSYAIVPYTLGCSVALTASPAGPANGQNVTFTAMPSGACSASAQYEWWAMPPGGGWGVGVLYSGASTLTVASSGVTAGTWEVAVWERAPGSSAAYDTYAIIPYVFNGAASAVHGSGSAASSRVTLPPVSGTAPRLPQGPGFPRILPAGSGG